MSKPQIEIATKRILHKQGMVLGTIEVTEEEEQLIKEEPKDEEYKLQRLKLDWNNGITQRDILFSRHMDFTRDPDFTQPPKTFTPKEQIEIDEFLKEFATQDEIGKESLNSIGNREHVTHLSQNVD